MDFVLSLSLSLSLFVCVCARKRKSVLGRQLLTDENTIIIMIFNIIIKVQQGEACLH